MPRESRQDGDHPEVAHPPQDSLLQRQGSAVPGWGEGSAPAPQVPHSRPGQESGAREVLVDLLLGQVQVSVNPLPDGFLAVEGQHQVVGVEGHPVDVFLPLLPVPPDEAVARRADVLVVTEPVVQGYCDVDVGEFFWKV